MSVVIGMHTYVLSDTDMLILGAIGIACIAALSCVIACIIMSRD